MTLNVTTKQLVRIRARVEWAREKMLNRDRVDIYVVFPEVRAAVDALPDLAPAFRLAPEKRSIIEVACHLCGVPWPPCFDEHAA